MQTPLFIWAGIGSFCRTARSKTKETNIPYGFLPQFWRAFGDYNRSRKSNPVVAWLVTWYKNYFVTTLRPATVKNYEILIRLHIKPIIGDIPLKQLTPTYLQQLYAALLTRGRVERPESENKRMDSLLRRCGTSIPSSALPVKRQSLSGCLCSIRQSDVNCPRKNARKWRSLRKNKFPVLFQHREKLCEKGKNPNIKKKNLYFVFTKNLPFGSNLGQTRFWQWFCPKPQVD